MNALIKRWGEQVIKRQQYAATLALIFAFLSFFNLPVGWISSVVVTLVTLQHGARQGAMTLAWAMLPAFAMLCLGNIAVFVNIMLFQYLLAMGFALVLRRYASWMTLFQAATALGILTVAVIILFLPDVHQWLITQIDLLIKEAQALSTYKMQPAVFDAWLNNFNHVATAGVVAGLILVNMLTVFVARKWQSEVVSNINLKKECRYLRTHYYAAFALAGLIGGLYFDNLFFLNLLVVASIPFIFSGLSIVHVFAAAKKNGTVYLLIFYALLILFMPYMIVFLTLLGWLDAFVNVRRKFIVENVVEQ